MFLENTLSMVMKRISLLTLIFIFLFSLQFPVSAAVEEPEPFLTTLGIVTEMESQRVNSEYYGQRIQNINLNFSQLTALEKEIKNQPVAIRLQIFPDLTLNAQFNQINYPTAKTKIFSGMINLNPNNYIHLAETDGVVSAEIVFQNIKYQLRQRNGVYYFIEVNQTAYPQEAEPVSFEKQLDETSLSSKIIMDQTTSDSGDLVDVMVLYTETARIAQGGTAGMENLISLAVAETNTGYMNSGINHRMRLVHTEEVAYSETDFNWSDALYRLQGQTDGYIDHIHNLRDLYGADLVVMIVADGYYCGIGFLLKTNSQTYDEVGFSVVSDDCATGYYSLAHETGHNMGAHHDRANASGTGLFSYSYGYQAPDQTFRTIMAYNCISGCIRINRWSNPDQLYNGQPLGVDASDPESADNRLTLNNSAFAVANFRQEVGIPAPSNLNAVEINAYYVTLSFTDNSDNESGFIIERSPDGSAWTTITTLASNTTSFTDSSITCESLYTYRVISFTDQLESAPSNSLPIETGACVPPDAPNQIEVIPQIFSISLLWSDTLGENNYQIQQSADGINNWITLQYLPANTTNTTISNLNKGTTYYFRIGAENTYGTNFTGVIVSTTHTQAVYLPLTLK